MSCYLQVKLYSKFSIAKTLKFCYECYLFLVKPIPIFLYEKYETGKVSDWKLRITLVSLIDFLSWISTLEINLLRCNKRLFLNKCPPFLKKCPGKKSSPYLKFYDTKLLQKFSNKLDIFRILVKVKIFFKNE